jgi:hypothetical protein
MTIQWSVLCAQDGFRVIGYNQGPVDPVPVHVYHFKSIALPDELLALGRHLVQIVVDKTGNGPKPTILLAP